MDSFVSPSPQFLHPPTMYTPMPEQEHLPSHVSWPTRAGTAMGLVRAVSMDLVNDPRFFSSSVIDKRLKAFKALSVVSTLMVSTSVVQLFKLEKEMDLSNIRGVLQLGGFACMSIIVFLCFMSTVTIIHQLFFMYRLLTSGPTGFETAASFYLNKNIVAWRHFAVKALGAALPLFLLSTGQMLFVMFCHGGTKERELEEKNLDKTLHRTLAIIVLSAYLFFAVVVYYIRHVHLSVFQEYYDQGRVVTLQTNTLQSLGGERVLPGTRLDT